MCFSTTFYDENRILERGENLSYLIQEGKNSVKRISLALITIRQKTERGKCLILYQQPEPLNLIGYQLSPFLIYDCFNKI